MAIVVYVACQLMHRARVVAARVVAARVVAASLDRLGIPPGQGGCVQQCFHTVWKGLIRGSVRRGLIRKWNTTIVLGAILVFIQIVRHNYGVARSRERE